MPSLTRRKEASDDFPSFLLFIKRAMKTVSNVYLLGFLVTLCVIIIDSTAHSTFRTRPRSTRGFKNAALSTARGFGKRDGFLQISEAPMDLPFDAKKEVKDDLKPVPDRFPIDWFTEELSKNPRLAKVIIKKFIDKNKDDELSSEELLQNLEY